MSLPVVKLEEGIHVMHLFYKVNRQCWEALPEGGAGRVLERLEALVEANSAKCQPRLDTFATIGPRADIAFVIYAAELGSLMQIHRDLEACFPPGTVECVYHYLSLTELSEYASNEEDYKRMLEQGEKLEPGSEEFEKRLDAMNAKSREYANYRLYPEMPKWEIMCFYPMLKRRAGNDNWYSLDFPERKKLMGGHARVGRTYAGRVSQLITSSTGLDDWEWGVTLMAHQLDAIRDIVYEMRFDEVSARYGEFGPFYVNLTLSPEEIWNHLKLD